MSGVSNPSQRQKRKEIRALAMDFDLAGDMAGRACQRAKCDGFHHLTDFSRCKPTYWASVPPPKTAIFEGFSMTIRSRK